MEEVPKQINSYESLMLDVNHLRDEIHEKDVQVRKLIMQISEPDVADPDHINKISDQVKEIRSEQVRLIESISQMEITFLNSGK